MAILEKGQVAFAFSSGMAATNAIFQGLQAGNHIIIPSDGFYSTTDLANEFLYKWGIEVSRIEMTDLNSVKKAIRPNTALIWIETPSNPTLKITDIAAIADLVRGKGIKIAVDNTWPSPILCNPLELGADFVMHSATKYIGGHGDVTGGIVVCKAADDFSEKIFKAQTLAGAVPSPFDCWLMNRGIKTLALRVKQQTENAVKLADYLASHSKVELVLYPGLVSHRGHEIAKRQMADYGAMLSVQIDGNAKNALAVTGKLKLFTAATSLGGVESLVEHRKSIEGENSPTPGNLLRVSVGIESADDLIRDWEQALG